MYSGEHSALANFADYRVNVNMGSVGLQQRLRASAGRTQQL